MKHYMVLLPVLLISLLVPASAEITLTPYGFTTHVDSLDEERPPGTKHSRIAVTTAETEDQVNWEYNLTGSAADLFSIIFDSTGAAFISPDSAFDYEDTLQERQFPLTISAAAAGKTTQTLDHTIHLRPKNDNEARSKNIIITLDEDSLARFTIGVDAPITDADIPAEANTWTIREIPTTPQKSRVDSFVQTEENTFIYDPRDSQAEVRLDSMSYKISDRAHYDNTISKNQTEYRVYFHIRNINDEVPHAGPDTIHAAEGMSTDTLITGAASLLANDSDLDNSVDSPFDDDTLPDIDDTLRTSLLSEPEHGSLTLTPEGTFTYTHDGSVNYSDSFTYLLSDGKHLDTGYVAVMVTEQNNHPPVFTADTLYCMEGGTVDTLASGASSLFEILSDKDLPYDSLMLTEFSKTSSAQGTYSVSADGAFSYTHDDSEQFRDSLRVIAEDAAGHTDTAVIPVFITPISDIAPVAGADTIAVREGDTARALISGATTLFYNDRDPEGDPFSIVDEARNCAGELTLNRRTGAFSYIPDQSDNVTDSCYYRLTDGTVTGDRTLVFIQIGRKPHISILTINRADLSSADASAALAQTDPDVATPDFEAMAEIRANIPMDPDGVELTVTITDALGNQITEYTGLGSNGTLFTAATNTPSLFRIFWNGTNSRGRSVGPGAYKVQAELTYLEDTARCSGMITVQK